MACTPGPLDLSSPEDPKACHTAFSPSYTHSHADGTSYWIVSTAALGQFDKGETAMHWGVKCLAQGHNDRGGQTDNPLIAGRDVWSGEAPAITFP